jgi:hypothetical protein
LEGFDLYLIRKVLIKSISIGKLNGFLRLPAEYGFNDSSPLINEPIPKLKIASLNPVFRIINRVSNHENNPKILDD